MVTVAETKNWRNFYFSFFVNGTIQNHYCRGLLSTLLLFYWKLLLNILVIFSSRTYTLVREVCREYIRRFYQTKFQVKVLFNSNKSFGFLKLAVFGNGNGDWLEWKWYTFYFEEFCWKTVSRKRKSWKKINSFLSIFLQWKKYHLIHHFFSETILAEELKGWLLPWYWQNPFHEHHICILKGFFSW